MLTVILLRCFRVWAVVLVSLRPRFQHMSSVTWAPDVQMFFGRSNRRHSGQSRVRNRYCTGFYLTRFRDPRDRLSCLRGHQDHDKLNRVKRPHIPLQYSGCGLGRMFTRRSTAVHTRTCLSVLGFKLVTVMPRVSEPVSALLVSPRQLLAAFSHDFS